MVILDVKSLAVPDLKVIRFGKFIDARGYFAETFRKSDFVGHSQLDFIAGHEFVQCNESYSKPGTVRGLHLQWDPYMGKLLRTLGGRMTDMALDVRKGSPTFGKIVLYDMPARKEDDWGEWLWVPPGFAHGNFFTEDSQIEYFCSGEYNPSCEACISPLAPDIDWAVADPALKEELYSILRAGPRITDKDRNGHSLASWIADPNSDRFAYPM